MLYFRVPSSRIEELEAQGWKLCAVDPIPWGMGRLPSVLMEKEDDPGKESHVSTMVEPSSNRL